MSLQTCFVVASSTQASGITCRPSHRPFCRRHCPNRAISSVFRRRPQPPVLIPAVAFCLNGSGEMSRFDAACGENRTNVW